MKSRVFEYQVGGEVRRHAMPASGSLVIGKAPGPASPNVLQLEAADLRDSHCVIGRTKSGGLAIKCLTKDDTVAVNGEAKSAVRLRVGDTVILGEIEIKICAGEEAAAAAPAPKPKPKRKGSLPERIGGFRIHKKLGKGGMGEVLLATQESLARQVALKLLKAELAADNEFVARFQAEAKAAAALNHPNVVHVYDVGVAEGRHYLAMEYMEGGTLESKLRNQGPLAWAEVTHVLREAAKGLAYAEERGIVHRDIKPDNLMLDGAGAVKLADLGLATETMSEGGDTKILGTPHFMAPEQARGASVDHRADLYALGATAWRLLTAKTPFEGATTRDILRAHFTEPVRPPSQVIPGIPASLDAIIVKLMAKEPNDRFPSARALGAALEESADQGTTSKSKAPLAVVGLLVAAGIGYGIFGGGGDEPTGPGTGSAGGNPEVADQGGETPGETFPEMPTVETNTEVADAGTAGAGDGDDALQKLENLARQAYGGLQQIQDPAARQKALVDLAGSFPGTTVSTEATLEAETIGKQLASASADALVQAGKLKDLLAVFPAVVAKAQTTGTGSPADPDGLLAELLEVPSPGIPTLMAEFEAERDKFLGQTLQGAIAYADSELQAAETSAQAGEFDAYRERLTALLPYFAMDSLEAEPEPADGGPDPDSGGSEDSSSDSDGASSSGSDSDSPEQESQDPKAGVEQLQSPSWFGEQDEDEAPTPDGTPEQPEQTETPEWMLRLGPLGLDDFLGRDRQTRDLIVDAGLRKVAWLDAQLRTDEASMGKALGGSGPTSFEASLRAMDFQRATAFVAPLSSGLGSALNKSSMDALSKELEMAAAAKALFISSFAAGEWRRDTLPDPHGKSKQATSVTQKAITLNTRSEAGSKDVAWAEYMEGPELIGGLFSNRLRRELTSEERSGVSSIIRMAAVLHAVEEANRLLDPADDRKFDQEDVESMLEGFDACAEWDTATSAETTVRERQAAAVLGQALLAKLAGEPATSAAHIEHLLTDCRQSLLVLLLTDGSDWRATTEK